MGIDAICRSDAALRIDILLSQIIYCQSSYNCMGMKNPRLSTAFEDVYLWEINPVAKLFFAAYTANQVVG